MRHDAVVAGGEVVALDSAGYGAVNITKSVTITGEGVHAAATSPSSGGSAVSVNGAGITVILREYTGTEQSYQRKRKRYLCRQLRCAAH